MNTAEAAARRMSRGRPLVDILSNEHAMPGMGIYLCHLPSGPEACEAVRSAHEPLSYLSTECLECAAASEMEADRGGPQRSRSARSENRAAVAWPGMDAISISPPPPDPRDA